MDPKPLKILIVDDSPVDREIFEDLLGKSEEFDYEVIQAFMGEKGMILDKEAIPDCILLDHNLPDMTGIEFVEDLRRLGSKTPIVMITGAHDEIVEHDAIAKGIVEFLSKGKFDGERLEKAITRAISTTRLHKGEDT